MPTDQCTPAKTEVLANNKPIKSNNLVFIRFFRSLDSVPSAVVAMLVVSVPLILRSRLDTRVVVLRVLGIRMHILGAINPSPLPWPSVDDHGVRAPVHRWSHPTESSEFGPYENAR